MKALFWTFCLLFMIVGRQLSAQGMPNESWRNISGEKYDWTKTLKPERSYMRPYEKKSWQLPPPDWSDVASVDIYRITPSGIFYKNSETCNNGQMQLSLEPGEAVSIFPSTGNYKTN